MVDGYTLSKGKKLKQFLISTGKAGLVCLLLAGCLDFPSAEVPGVETDNLLPSAVIISPSKITDLKLVEESDSLISSNIYLEGSDIVFEGIGFDPEDDTLGSASLQWTSDMSGELGTGSTFTKSDLPPGTHWIYLEANDSSGATARDSVYIAVTTGSEENLAPVAEILTQGLELVDGVLYLLEDESLILEGSGVDNEDGTLSGSSLYWSSSLNEGLGTGESLDVTGKLSVGDHVVTLTAFDSNEATGSDSIYITVEESLPPLSPSNLVARAISSTSIELTWQDNSDNETYFNVEQRVGDLFKSVTEAKENKTSAVITGLKANTLYEFRVNAENSIGSSDYSNIAEETTFVSELISIATADNTLDSYQADVVAGEKFISIGFDLLELNAEYRAALQFGKLQEQIMGRTIASATLIIYSSVELLNVKATFAVNPFLEPWDPARITWNNQPPYDESIQSEQTVPTELLASDPLKFDVTEIVGLWSTEEKLANNGLVVRGVPDLISSVFDFHSLETSQEMQEQLEPQLYIQFKD